MPYNPAALYRKYFLRLLLAPAICTCSFTCQKPAAVNQYPFQTEGLLQKSGMTTYMYGTHTISNANQTYALQSKQVNLDLYTNKKVVVKGSKVKGYPVDGGPELIDVAVVEQP